jgi:uncharacterized protein (TIGR02246 family)
MTAAAYTTDLGPVVEEILDGFRECFRTKDADAFVSYLHPEVDFVDALGKIRHGRDSIAAEMRDLYAGVFADVDPSWEALTPRRLAPSVGLVHLRQRLATADGPLAPEQWFTLLLVLEHDGERWLVRAFHNTWLKDMPGVPAPDEWESLAAARGED